jgi:hypothetical protein
MNLLAASSEVSVITDGLTRRLEYSRPKGLGINPKLLNFIIILEIVIRILQKKDNIFGSHSLANVS